VFECPGCAAPLERVESDGPRHWACRGCGGRALTVGALRRAFPAEFAEAALSASAAGGWRGRRRCPLCTMHMVGRRVKHGGHEFALDHCDQCRLLWFDPGEHEAAAGGAAPPPPIPGFDEPRQPRSWSGGAGDDAITATEGFSTDHWTDIAVVLGLPAPEGDALWRRPWATWLLAVAIAAASFLAFFSGGERVVRDYALHASDPFRLGGFEWISSFFLHWDYWHLVGNLYFLVLFGVCVEDALRPGKYLLLVALSKVAGSLLYVALSAGGGGASAGASGGISGIIVFWALAFPHARVRGLWWGWLWTPFTVSFSSRTWLAIWIGLQVVGASLQVSGIGGVNYFAHLGGGVAGAAFWAFGPEGPWARVAQGATIRRSPPPRAT
jgi:membrane associated rhomboid family serine protease/Zn-finger nucleic acid-binding protein